MTRLLAALLLLAQPVTAAVVQIPTVAAPSAAAFSGAGISAVSAALPSIEAAAAQAIVPAATLPSDDKPSISAALPGASAARDLEHVVPVLWHTDAVAAEPDEAAPSAAAQAAAAEPRPGTDRIVPIRAEDLPKMFSLTRRALTRDHVQKFLKTVFKDQLTITKAEQKAFGLPDQIKEMSQSQFMLLLALNKPLWKPLESFLDEMEAAEKKKGGAVSKAYKDAAKKWTDHFKAVLQQQHVVEKFKRMNDPKRSMQLVPEGGKPGYYEQALYADTPRLVDGKEIPADDLRQKAVDFIDQAKKEIMFNVFDFDLMAIAAALIRAADRGVKITGGIYKGNIDDRPEVKAVFEKLKSHKNITMVSVNSVGLNHQKMIARDYNDEALAASLLSSGNFTQSCIGPEGDLCQVAPEKRPKDSVPNANHMVVMKGLFGAQIIANNMSLTLEYGLRGKEYPLGGAFTIFRDKPAGWTEAENPSMTLSFAPKGTLGDVNRDMIVRTIKMTRGILRVMVFAFSSKEVKQAIIERVKAEIDEKGTVDFKAFGDTPFTMRDYSVLLQLAGFSVRKLANGGKKYVVDPKSELAKALGKERFAKFQESLRVAPREYGEHSFDSIKYNAKIHHKVFVSGIWAIIGTSFNPSDNAEHNNEQIMVTNDPDLRGGILGVFDWLFGRTARSIAEETTRRNERGEIGNDEVGGQYAETDRQARGKAKAKPKAKTAPKKKSRKTAFAAPAAAFAFA
jgi:hypothetical protein